MIEYVFIAFGILLAAYHSGNETGLYCLNRLRMRLRAERGNRRACILTALTRQPQRVITTMLIGTNLGIYLVTVLSTGKLRAAGLRNADLWSGLLLPPFLLLLADFMPKALFQHHTETLMYRTAHSLRFVYLFWYPVSGMLRLIARLPQRLLGRGAPPKSPQVTDETVRFYFSKGVEQGVLSPFQRRATERIMRLRSVPVTDAMTPLAELVMVERSAPYDELLARLRDHHYWGVPVYEGDRSNVVGVVTVLDVAGTEEVPAGAADAMREVMRLPAHVSVDEALRELREARQRFAAVVDEGDRAVGVVTVRDLVEEVVGEIAAW